MREDLPQPRRRPAADGKRLQIPHECDECLLPRFHFQLLDRRHLQQKRLAEPREQVGGQLSIPLPQPLLENLDAPGIPQAHTGEVAQSLDPADPRLESATS